MSEQEKWREPVKLVHGKASTRMRAPRFDAEVAATVQAAHTPRTLNLLARCAWKIAQKDHSFQYCGPENPEPRYYSRTSREEADEWLESRSNRARVITAAQARGWLVERVENVA